MMWRLTTYSGDQVLWVFIFVDYGPMSTNFPLGGSTSMYRAQTTACSSSTITWRGLAPLIICDDTTAVLSVEWAVRQKTSFSLNGKITMDEISICISNESDTKRERGEMTMHHQLVCLLFVKRDRADHIQGAMQCTWPYALWTFFIISKMLFIQHVITQTKSNSLSHP